jgi:hypothetical protein
VVCIGGAEVADYRLVGRDVMSGEKPGCALSDAQFDVLARHLKIPEPTLAVKVRARIDFIRRFYLRSRLYEAERPTQAERNAALTVVSDRVEAFRAAMAALGRVPERVVSEVSPIEDPSPFRIFMTFPQRLRVLAGIAAEHAAPTQRRDRHRAAFLALSHSAAALADALSLLDHASREDVVNHLPWAQDYEMDCFADMARLAPRLDAAVSEALAAGRKRGGPLPFHELPQTVAWLRAVYKGCGGRFTHTPRVKTAYDGTPHSAAGQFVLEFFKICDPTLRAHSISSAMAQVVSRSRHDERGEVFLID